MVRLYDSFTLDSGTHVRGALTLGENLADLGGVRMALRAYHRERGECGDPHLERELVRKYFGDEVTPDQLFYVAYAQSWCAVQRPEYLEYLVRTNPHSPARFRVNGPLSQMPEFGEAFQCARGAAMQPPQMCEVW